MTIAADLQRQVYDLLSRASNISFVTLDEESGIHIGLTPGQRVSAEVLTLLPDTRTQVKIGNERYNLDLPITVRPGQTLEMTFVSADPRSTFAIARQAAATPAVSLSDASRLISLLASSEQSRTPEIRASLQSIGDMLRRSSGDAGVLANLLDEVLTYSAATEGVSSEPSQVSAEPLKKASIQQQDSPSPQGTRHLTPEQSRMAAFESNAAQILKNIAQNSRSVLLEAVNHPVTPLPLIPGTEVNATVVGTLPGNRVFVDLTGVRLELQMPKAVQTGEILKLTYISSEPKPTFAIPKSQPEFSNASLSEAGRWLSVLEHSEGGVSGQQAFVLERLNTVLKSLPSDSPAFTAIKDEAITYQKVMRGQAERATTNSSAMPKPIEVSSPNASIGEPALKQGLQNTNGVVLSDDMARLLQAVIKGNRLALLEAINQQTAPTGFVPGQQLKGEVIAALGGGRFMVSVAGQALEFALPKGIRRGDNINLFFITEEPLSTFLMVRFGRIGDSTVSDTGRWLSRFLASASERSQTLSVFDILRTLFSSAPTDASEASRTLQQGLRESGLFYESHLARWFGGEYPLVDLLKEPQGLLSPRLMRTVARQESHPEMPLQTPLGGGAEEITEAIFRKAAANMPHDGIADQRTLPVVGEQLSTLQNGQLIFRGDLFPGQRLEWGVTEREAHRNESGEMERTWETSLNLNLPELGPVGAKLRVDGARISVDIFAENANTVSTLDAGRSTLSEQLEAAGLTPLKISVQNAAA